MQTYLQSLLLIISMMTLLWLISVIIKNASIVDLFWGLGFVICNIFYYLKSNDPGIRNNILLLLVTIWGLRLSIFLSWRNIGKGEDFRYKQFRKNYGEHRYWWVSFFQTFLLQGVLMWMVSATLLGAHSLDSDNNLNFLDYLGISIWVIGFVFETGGDLQLAVFKSNPINKGKILNKGFWKYTRHPNYFGDAAVWWGYGLICIASGNFLPVLGSIIMTILLIKVSGVSLLEKSLTSSKPGYEDYIRQTSSFIPWFPKD